MYAREQKNEYDPTSSPVVERPLAAGRPLSTQVQGNSFGGQGLDGMRKKNANMKGHRRAESSNSIPLLSPTKPSMTEGQTSPSRTSSTVEQHSADYPADSDMHHSAKSFHEAFMDRLENGDQRAVLRGVHRNTKSVTFDAAPPQVNEYEMVTPVPSSVASGSREGSFESMDSYDYEDCNFGGRATIDIDDSFDASLEDTEKTPVVLPEDWRHMSPTTADVSLALKVDDPFGALDSSPTALARPYDGEGRPQERSDSTSSDGESRPLPPLPNYSSGSPVHRKRNSSIGLSTTVERLSGSQRSLPIPPGAASVSKSEILSMRDSSISLEDRFHLMELKDGSKDSPFGQQSEEYSQTRNSNRHAADDGIQIHEDGDDNGDELAPEGLSIPRISRESILRRVQSRTFDHDDSDESSADYSLERDYSALANLDPDVPIPSRETSSDFQPLESDAYIKQEEDADCEVDMSAIPEMTGAAILTLGNDDFVRQESVIRHPVGNDHENAPVDDDASHYSSPSSVIRDYQAGSNSGTEDEGPPTPTPRDFLKPSTGADRPLVAGDNFTMAIPEFESFLSADDFNMESLRSYMSTPPHLRSERNSAEETTMDKQEQVLKQIENGNIGKESHLGHGADAGRTTPDMINHHSSDEEDAKRDSITVPEPVATIKAPGSKLKTRPSATPHDLASMAAARRQVSGERPPPIPSRHPRRQSMCADITVDAEKINCDGNGEDHSEIKLDIPVSGISDGLTLGLDQEFDRLLEAQKVTQTFTSCTPFSARNGATAEYIAGQGFSPHKNSTDEFTRTQKGYLMRQNTKMVVASSRKFSDEEPPTASAGDGSAIAPRGTRSAGNSPRKASQEKGSTWTAEPWNGKMRRKSLRQTSGARQQRAQNGPRPAPTWTKQQCCERLKYAG